MEPIKDRDLLITLNVKVDNLAIEVKDLKEGIGEKLSDHELRLRGVEQSMIDFKATANLYRVVSGMIGGVIIFFITQVPNWLKVFGVGR